MEEEGGHFVLSLKHAKSNQQCTNLFKYIPRRAGAPGIKGIG